MKRNTALVFTWKKMALFYNIATAFLNPVIYSLRNKDVKNAFLKLMGRGRARTPSTAAGL